MNKTGHLLLTKEMIPQELKGYTFWIQLGSILPDLLFHTYIMGHTWNATFGKTLKKMDYLNEWGSLNSISCLYLGCIVHYVEDYFTYPHNDSFHGSLTAHMKYEHKQMKYLKRKNHTSWGIEDNILDLHHMECYLIKLHNAYCEENSNMELDVMESDNIEIDHMETDRLYGKEAAQNVLFCFAEILKKKKEYYQLIQQEALQTGMMNYSFFFGMGDYWMT